MNAGVLYENYFFQGDRGAAAGRDLDAKWLGRNV